LIPNNAATDPRLVGDRLHVWLMMRSQRDGLEVTPADMARRLRMSLATLKRHIAALEEGGLLERSRERRRDGSWGAATYLVRSPHDTPRRTPAAPGPQPPAPPRPAAQRDEAAPPPAPAGPPDDDAHTPPGPVNEPWNDTPATSDDPQTPSSDPQLNPEPSLHTRREDQQNAEPAPSARGPHARRAPHVPRAPRRGGRPAATAPRPRPHPRTVPAADLGRVLAAIPPPLRPLLPARLPRSVAQAVRDALGERTPDQLTARIDRRWCSYGYEIAADPRCGGTGLSRPVGVLLTLLRPGPCPDPRCEDGVSVDTGARCPRCLERARDRARPARVSPEPPAPPRAPQHARSTPAAGPCPEHPGSAVRVDPQRGIRECAGCWSARTERAQTLLGELVHP